jgi:hypothetical protein
MLAKASVWPIVPRNIGLNWFIPALVKSKVGSLWGTTEEEGTEELELARSCCEIPSYGGGDCKILHESYKLSHRRYREVLRVTS